MRCFPLLILPLLVGCIAGQKGDLSQQNSPPIVKVMPAKEVDTEKLRKGIKEDTRQEVIASSTSTAAQMTGAVNASVSKLAEKLTGVEANLTATMNNTANLNTQANAELRAKFDASLTAITTLKAELSIANEFNAKLESKIDLDANLIKDLKAQIGQLNTQLTAQMSAVANGQVGLSNKIESTMETVTATAGRDVNYLPKEAAMVMIANEKANARVIVAIVSILAGVISGAIAWLGRIMYKRADAERQLVNSLLLEVTSKMSPSEAERFEPKLAMLRPQVK